MIIPTVLSVLFFVWILRNVLFWTWLWQVKEYRLDRMKSHLKETVQGKALIYSPRSILKFTAIALYVFVAFFYNLFPLFSILVFIIYLIESINVFREIGENKLRRPKFTIKTISISLLALSFAGLLYVIPLFALSFWVLVVDRIVTFFMAFVIFIMSYPTEFYYDLKVERAMKKMREYRKVLVIGITGSYGKSSTKEYVASVLSAKFKVLKTKGTNNTRIGVAQTVLSGISKDTEIFVTEMGAYKKGEISEICSIVNPKIGILTSVSPQHASLFGGIANIMETKYELIKALPKNGLAMFNGNNTNAVSLYQQTEVHKVLYKVDRDLGNTHADIKATHVITSKYGISFAVEKGKRKLKLKTPLIGMHNVENILPAVYIAWYLGMDDADIADAVASLKPLPHTMVLKKLPNGTVVIDSTFNANPQSFMTIFDYAKLYSGKKILVMQPMIELGGHGQLEHYKVGYHASTAFDYVFVTNKNFYEDLEKGIMDAQGKCVLKFASLSKIANFITVKTNRRHSNNLTVFLGRETGAVLHKLL